MADLPSNAYLDPDQALKLERVRKVELLISNLLRTGVIVSLVIVVIGMLLTFVHHPAYADSADQLNSLTAPGAAFPRTLLEVIDGLVHFQGRAIVMVGLAFLIATPVLRVAISIFAFAYQHDRTYVLITTAVLLLLLASFVLGKVES
jgi:uncharacterized membrane protein